MWSEHVGHGALKHCLRRTNDHTFACCFQITPVESDVRALGCEGGPGAAQVHTQVATCFWNGGVKSMKQPYAGALYPQNSECHVGVALSVSSH
jgi:hypothetical protein